MYLTSTLWSHAACKQRVVVFIENKFCCLHLKIFGDLHLILDSKVEQQYIKVQVLLGFMDFEPRIYMTKDYEVRTFMQIVSQWGNSTENVS